MNLFKGLKKNNVTIDDLIRVSKNAKDSAYNQKSNKICVRFYNDLSFRNSEDVYGEIFNSNGLPVILITRPIDACIMYVEECTYYNKSKENELTINAVKDYPFGIDLKSDLTRYKNIEYLNGNFILRISDKSQKKYYDKKYKFYIPVLMNNIPLPIIKLDNADRILKNINDIEVKRLCNISQTFLRQFIRTELLKRTGNKKDGIGWIAVFFIAIGMILMTILNLLLS